MLDDMNTQGPRSSGDSRGSDSRGSDSRSQQRAGVERQPLTDREVPLGQSRTSAAIHAWLDGEMPESAIRTAESAREMDFWRKVTEETAQRRAVRAPADLEAQIMAALPTDAAVEPTKAGWLSKDVTMTPATAAVAAASLLAAGAAATVAVLRVLR